MRCRRMGFASNHSDDSDGLDNKELGPQHRGGSEAGGDGGLGFGCCGWGI